MCRKETRALIGERVGISGQLAARAISRHAVSVSPEEEVIQCYLTDTALRRWRSCKEGYLLSEPSELRHRSSCEGFPGLQGVPTAITVKQVLGPGATLAPGPFPSLKL